MSLKQGSLILKGKIRFGGLLDTKNAPVRANIGFFAGLLQVQHSMIVKVMIGLVMETLKSMNRASETAVLVKVSFWRIGEL